MGALFAGVFGFTQLQALMNAGILARLGGTVMPNAALSSDVVSWEGQYDNIFGIGGIPNYQGSDAASLRFSNTPGSPAIVDSGANYWWRSLFVSAGSTLISENAAGSNDTLIQLGEKTNNARVFAFHIVNFPSKPKILKAWNAIGLPGTVKGDAMISLEGQWNNTAGPIQAIQMVTLSKNMGAGSNFSVFGLNSQTPY